jgi:hypothetical protein
MPFPCLDRAVQRDFGYLKRLADILNGVLWIVIERLGNSPLLRSESFWSPADSPSGSGSSEPRLCPFPNQVSLKLRKCAEDMKDQFSTAGCGVNILSQALKPNPPTSRSVIVVIRCGRDRPKRSNRQTTSVSPFRT